MTPLVIGSAQLYHGDAVEMLAALPDRSLDAIIADPPYCSGAFSEAGRTAARGQGLRSETIKRIGWFIGDNMGTVGIALLLRLVAFIALDKIKPSGSMLLFCDWRMVPTLAPAIESAGWRYQNMVVWDKGTPGLGYGFRSQHEVVLHFTAGAPEYFDATAGNVFRASRVPNDDREHQTQKPADLLLRLARVVTPPGGVIADPFMGSGSTGLAAHAGGFGFVGIERDRVMFDIAARRIAEGSTILGIPEQPALFVDAIESPT